MNSSFTVENLLYLREGRLRYCYERSPQSSSRKDDSSPAISFEIGHVSKPTKFVAFIFCTDSDGKTLHKNFITGDIAKEDCGFGIFELHVEAAENIKFYLSRASSEIRVVPTKQNNVKTTRHRHTPKDDPPEVRFEERRKYLQKLKELFPDHLGDIKDGNNGSKGRSSSCHLTMKLIDVETGALSVATSKMIKSGYKTFRVDTLRYVKESNVGIFQLSLKLDGVKDEEKDHKFSMVYRSASHVEYLNGRTDHHEGKTFLVTFQSSTLNSATYGGGDSFQISFEGAQTPVYEVKCIDPHGNLDFDEKAPKIPDGSVVVNQDYAKGLQDLQLFIKQPALHHTQFVAVDNQQTFVEEQLCFNDEERGQENENYCQRPVTETAMETSDDYDYSRIEANWQLNIDANGKFDYNDNTDDSICSPTERSHKAFMHNADAVDRLNWELVSEMNSIIDSTTFEFDALIRLAGDDKIEWQDIKIDDAVEIAKSVGKGSSQFDVIPTITCGMDNNVMLAKA